MGRAGNACGREQMLRRRAQALTPLDDKELICLSCTEETSDDKYVPIALLVRFVRLHCVRSGRQAPQ